MVMVEAPPNKQQVLTRSVGGGRVVDKTAVGSERPLAQVAPVLHDRWVFILYVVLKSDRRVINSPAVDAGRLCFGAILHVMLCDK